MNTKFLPIGTVVMLKEGKKALMITGYLPVTIEENNKVYDYSGCLYPEGILDSNQNAVFNHDQIEKILFLGYANNQYIDLNRTLSQVSNSAEFNDFVNNANEITNNN